MRYQFEPREGHFLNFEEAREAIKEAGGTHVKVVFPVMCSRYRDGKYRYWRGTNQPKTLSFSATDEIIARLIEDRYGWARAFVRERAAVS